MVSSASTAWVQGVHITPQQLVETVLGWFYSLWQQFIALFKLASEQKSAPRGPPSAPALRVVDARSTRVKLLVLPQLNTEEDDEFQLRYRLDDEPDTYLGAEHENEENWIIEAFRTGTPRNLLALHQYSKYKARARVRTKQGTCSEWGPLIKWQTLLSPVNGGADMGSYTWGQNATEVWVTVDIPDAVKSKHISVVLRPDYLHASHTLGGSSEPVELVQGQLPHRVRLLAPAAGSHWEISRDSGTSQLSVVLEKETPAANLRCTPTLHWLACFF